MLRLDVIPEAKNVSVIRSNTTSSELETPLFITENVTRADIENFWVLSSLAENSNYLTHGPSIPLKTILYRSAFGFIQIRGISNGKLQYSVLIKIYQLP